MICSLSRIVCCLQYLVSLPIEQDFKRNVHVYLNSFPFHRALESILCSLASYLAIFCFMPILYFHVSLCVPYFLISRLSHAFLFYVCFLVKACLVQHSQTKEYHQIKRDINISAIWHSTCYNLVLCGVCIKNLQLKCIYVCLLVQQNCSH